MKGARVVGVWHREGVKQGARGDQQEYKLFDRTLQLPLPEFSK